MSHVHIIALVCVFFFVASLGILGILVDFGSWETHWRTPLDRKCFLWQNLTVSIGQHFGKACMNKAFQNTWFGWFRNYMTGNLERSSDHQVEAENSTSLAACDEGAFWALASFVPCYSLPCGNGGWKLGTLALICRMGCRISLIYDLQESSARQRCVEMVGLHANFVWIGTKKNSVRNTTSSKRQRCIMPTNTSWRTGGFLFLSVSAILILLFHRLRALQVGIVPFTRNTYKPWTFILENSAGPLWALPRTLIGHWHGMKSCTLETSELHILFALRRFRAGPDFVVVRIGNWHLILLNAPFTTGYEEFCIGNPWGKGGSGVQNFAPGGNWRCIVDTKDWFIGRRQHKTENFGGNM